MENIKFIEGEWKDNKKHITFSSSFGYHLIQITAKVKDQKQLAATDDQGFDHPDR